ncbi:type II secretion system F family protein [Elusimicrobiota bacterium]
MVLYNYKVRNTSGKTISGEMEAESTKAVSEKLREQRLIVMEVVEASAGGFDFTFGFNPFKKKTKAKDIVIFSRQMATLVGAGVPIVQGLSILTEQIENPVFKEIVTELREDIEGGAGIAESMEKHPGAFNELFVNMIRAGELGGILDIILERVADYLESSNNLKGKVKGALMYPAVVSSVAMGVTAFLMIVIIPTFAATFESFGGELPLPTQILINISDVMRRYFHFILLGIIGIVIAGKRFYKTESGSMIIDKKLLDVPVFGTLLRKVAIAKFTRTFGTLVKSGVPILEALETVAHTSGNRVVEAAVIEAREAIREGSKIADPLNASGVFPPMVMQMISVGEETGNLDTMLSKIADFYDAEVDVAVEGLTSMIEPIIIVFMGILIGAIVIAMFLPIFSMGDLIK